MGGFFKFLKIYETNLFQEPSLEIISDPVKIEILREAHSYKIPLQMSRMLPAGENHLITKDSKLTLNVGQCHIVFTARSKEKNPVKALKICEDEIDRLITILSTLYTPGIFDFLVYSGPLLEDKPVFRQWVQFHEKILLDSEWLSDELSNIKRGQSTDPDKLDRFKLMSRFYSKSLSYDPSEEKFISLWTILEIYPMKDTSDIRPISDHLAEITDRRAEEVKNKLGIGRLYGHRCDLVHDGKLNLTIEEMGDIITKLENIVHEILRNMSGLPYNGSLDKYFT